MTLLSAGASLVSALIAAGGWMGHQLRALSVAPKAWSCLECGVPNELDRDTCWSCGAGYGEDPLYPSHIPFERRWLCPECAVWNGIARPVCWRCGATRQASDRPRDGPQSRDAASRRRNT